MCFYPMNHIPDWKGTGAAACMKRSLIIPFYADLSRFDKKNFDFAKETFTADFMCEFMGSVFAYANYYSRHELEFSGTMLFEQNTLEEEVDSAVTYRKLFEKYFDGFDNLRTLYDDYLFWCKSTDKGISQKKEFKFVFREYFTKRSTYKMGHEIVNGYRLPKPNHLMMHEESSFPECGRLAYLHEHNASVIERLETYYSEKVEG